MFKKETFANLLKAFGDTVARFTFSVLVAGVGTACALLLTSNRFRPDNEELYIRALMICAIALPFTLAVALWLERKTFSTARKWMVQIAALVICAAYYFTLLGELTAADYMRFSVMLIALHCLVAFAPFIASGENNGFWQFNKSLFLRFLTSALYTGVLYLGLALAIFACDELFGLHVRGEYYLRLWIVLVGLFSTVFFFAGVPRNIGALEQKIDYPKALKIFTQFVLLPLVTLYLLILYIYMIKIIGMWSLPKGWVSYLVLGFSVAGILSLLLIWPIRNEEGNNWINIFSRWFYRALFPLIILLFAAIGKRVFQYGITESRYYVVLMALWLFGIAVYFLFSKQKNIKVIPVSLFLLGVFSSFGPLSVFDVSRRSQVARLENLLVENNILVDGKIKKHEPALKDSAAVQITSLVDYLDRMHGLESIQGWFDPSADSVFTDSEKYRNKSFDVLGLMGVEQQYAYYGMEEDHEGFRYFSYYTNRYSETIDVKGYDYLCKYYGNFYYENDNQAAPVTYLHVGSDSLRLEKKKSTTVFIVYLNQEKLFDVDLFPLLKENHVNNKNYNSMELIKDELFLENSRVKLKLRFTNINGQTKKYETFKLETVEAEILFAFKNQK